MQTWGEHADYRLKIPSSDYSYLKIFEYLGNQIAQASPSLAVGRVSSRLFVDTVVLSVWACQQTADALISVLLVCIPIT